MNETEPKVRLHVDSPLHEGAEIVLDRGQSTYLVTVMRLEAGAAVAVFDGRSGEWRAELTKAHRKAAVLVARARTREQEPLPDLHLLFAPIRKARTDFIVEKACEMGCARVRPVLTRYTRSDRLNLDRLRAHMIEAAEQCGGIAVPGLDPAEPLAAVLDGWPRERRLVFCDESRVAPPFAAALAGTPRGAPAAVLIGPEGGFAPEEAERLRAHPAAIPVSLGPRVLRADTAAVAALALAQSALGDWQP